MRRLAATFVVLGIVVGIVIQGRGVDAQQTPPSLPGAADPNDCRVEPRSLEAFLRPYATPSATVFDPRDMFKESPRPLPEGEPADSQTAREIERALEELAACEAAGDERRLLALSSDDWIRRSFPADEELLRETYRDRTEGRSIPGNSCDYTSCSWVMTLEPLEIRRLTDGRVGVVVDGPPPPEMPVTPGQTVRQLLIFVDAGERYVIDDVFFVDVSDNATPVP